MQHPGAGMSGGYTALHVTGAFVVVGAVLGVFVLAEKHFDAALMLQVFVWANPVSYAVSGLRHGLHGFPLHWQGPACASQ